MSSGGPPAHLLRRALKEVRAVYRQADAAYLGFCCPSTSECCQLSTTLRPPWLFLPEWLLLVERLRLAAQPLPPPRADGGCAFLDPAGLRCTVYADRPLGCRTFFCHRRQGRGDESSEQMNLLTMRLQAAGCGLDEAQTEPRALPDWVEEARTLWPTAPVERYL